MRSLLVALSGLLALAADAPPKLLPEVRQRLDADMDRLLAFYKDLHAHPELSLQEERTAAQLAKELREAGLDVTTKVGGHGIVGLLRNGPGPTVMIRADMDALPIVEQTGLPYASKVRTRDRFGNEVGVMHACGHDMNLACLVGTARVLASLKDRWQGTLMCVGQPAEEVGAGARQMLADGLFRRFPKPDFGLALHCDSSFAYGQVRYREGQMQANVDSVTIVVRGKGGHGAAPHITIDPIVLAARIILDLQTIVSRETNPVDPVVVTVGSIHGGTKHNIIPNECRLQVTVRTTTDATRKHTLEAIERIAKAAAVGARAPEPIIEVDPSEFTPALFNDPGLTRRLVPVLQRVLGADNVRERPLSMGGEDFSLYGREGVPTFYYFLGTQEPGRVAAAERSAEVTLPGLHSNAFYPVPAPTLRTGVTSMTMLVLELMGKP
ncbi:MAG: amidohydrolase [Gemmataceae bacterium]|nr:amidohydrolase [Gemmataceae bacterium]MDW8264227.1 amidohydrolase [Gemmataceae bacterium]